MEKKIKIVCYYHNDPDGIVSATIVKYFYESQAETFNQNHIVHCVKCDYDKIPQVNYDYDICIVVDFCFNPETMNKLFLKYDDKFIWIDHHITAKKEAGVFWETVEGLRGLDNSACMLTWEYFYPGIKAPSVVKYVEDMDLWKWEYIDKSKPFNEVFYMRHNSPEDPIVGDMLYDDRIVQDYVLEGEIILEKQRSQVEKSFASGKDIKWEGWNTRIVNTNHDQSQVGEYCYKQNQYPIAFIWYLNGDTVIVSLRSDTVDVGSLAKKHGGGGHEFASGFETTLKQIQEWCKE